MRAIGFNQGQLGDLVINTIVCRAFKEKFPNSHLTFGLNKKYESMAPIFLRNKLIDNIHIWDGYDDWPTQKDQRYIDKQNFDVVFNPMAKVIDNLWYTKHHHSIEFCRMHSLHPPSNLQVSLTPWFPKLKRFENCIAFTCFTSGGEIRNIPVELAKLIVDYIHQLGFDTVQLGLKSHPDIQTKFGITGGSIFEDVQIAYSCKMLFTADTGMNYVMSGYSQKVLGLYATSSWPIKAPIIHRIPVNPNAKYLEADNILDINIDLIFSSIKQMLCT